MKIVVLNGSPKGEVGVTHQYTAYLEKVFPGHRWVTFHAAKHIRDLAGSPESMARVREEVESADAVVWAFPLYFLLVSSQYKRFMELASRPENAAAFRGKYAVAISTSINFFDSSAHDYVRSVSEDLGMRFIGSFSAKMYDLAEERERERLRTFARIFLGAAARGAPASRLTVPLPQGPLPRYEGRLPVPVHSLGGKRAVILTDALPGQENLLGMVSRLSDAWGGAAELVNLHDLDIKGGCQGCLRCGAEYRCAYTGKDGFIDFYNEKLRTADIIVFAGALAARQLSWKWREFFDRSFFNTHTPSLTGKQIAFVVSGHLRHLPELRQLYEAWVEIQRSNLTGFVSDDADSPAAIDGALDELASSMVELSRAAYVRPRTFLGVGGMKVFRDDIWAHLRVVFRADHEAYKRLGVYDFPQRRLGERVATRLAWIVTGLPGIRGRFPSMIRTRMADPLRKVVERARA